MTSFMGQVSVANMMSPGGKLTAMACHLTKRYKESRGTNLSLLKLFIRERLVMHGPPMFIDTG
jgi:hypothetical protein